MAWTYGSTYTQVNDYSFKDGLASGQAEKIILGADIDDELSGIATALNVKLDSSSVSSTAEAQAGIDTESVMTPANVTEWSNAGGGGHVGELWNLTDPAADRILFYDFSAGAGSMLSQLTVSTGLSITGTNLTTNDSAIVHDSLSGFVADEHVAHSGVSVIAASGGLAASNNDLSSNIGLSIDVSTLTDFGTTAGADLDADWLIIDDGGTEKKVLASQVVTPEVPAADASATYTLAESDFGKVVRLSNAAPAVTLPNGLKAGFWCTLIYTGTPGAGMSLSATTTLNTANSLTTCVTQHAAVTCVHVGSNVWHAWGALDS